MNSFARPETMRAPTVVAIPPCDAHRSLVKLPSGEIRCYGSDDGVRVFLTSRDNGLNWETRLVDDYELGAMTKSPRRGDWLALATPNDWDLGAVWPALRNEAHDGCGLYVIRSVEGPGGKKSAAKFITSEAIVEPRLPFALRKSPRLICTAQAWIVGGKIVTGDEARNFLRRGERAVMVPVVLRSDDEGETWQWTLLETVETRDHEKWHAPFMQFSCEPSAVELDDGRLMLIARTSQFEHWIYFSADFGETWSTPAPAPLFHAVTTMPTFLRMSDGRILLFWCNTRPMPELDHRTQNDLSADEISGIWEDVFTNRDACHCALLPPGGDWRSDWRGFREIGLNEARNRADFRAYRAAATPDKSVHQFEALELPHGKILLSYGQAPACRRLVIFDPDWLLETSRAEDFRGGLENVSTQVYIKSWSGGIRPGVVGHCSWNRQSGARLVPADDGSRDEVLLLMTPNDPWLFNNLQGVVWNFPAASRGLLKVRIKNPGQAAKIFLTDCWVNPSDPTIASFAKQVITLEKSSEWRTEEIPISDFVSYAIVQTTSPIPEFEGILIKSLSFTASE